MSLTSLLKNKDVKEKFAQEFPMPKFHLTGAMVAQPITTHYSLVGTAFDYLMRFHLKRINPNAITQEWVAESVVKLVQDKNILKKVKEILTNAKETYSEYLQKGEMNDETIKTCLLLAQLDPIYRAGVIDPNIGNIESGDIEDLKNLLKLVKPQDFISKQICMLNPTFGEASDLVSGADMDLLLDATLIDIKTTKFLELNRDHLNQIIGYYILSLIGGIDNAPKNMNIEFIGIYYSRHGLLFRISVKEITAKTDLKKFISWFKKRAEQEFFFCRGI